ncbi:hypothetical protein ACFL4A_03625 [bacterium]
MDTTENKNDTKTLDYKIHRVIAYTSMFSVILSNFIKWTSLIVIIYFIHKSIFYLSGKTADANILIKVLGNINIKTKIAYSFGFVGVLYGYLQRKLRKDKVAELADRNKQLEKIIHNNRSSSKLTPLGNTRKEDAYV